MNFHAVRLKHGLKRFVVSCVALPPRPFAALVRPPC
jgi:hypothetical protein